jgi:microcystin-dependent protein
MDPFVGEIKMVGFNFAPRGYAFCNANLLSIQQNAALFSLLGTTFGGNGTTNFQLPDYRGRSPVGMGNGPGLSQIVQGQLGGGENVTLNLNQIPNHAHSVAIPANSTTSDGAAPAAASVLGTATPASRDDPTPNIYLSTGVSDVTLKPFNTAAVGSNLPFAIRNPYLGTNFIIALSGVFPSRN